MREVKIEIEADGPKGYRISLILSDKGHLVSSFFYCDTFTVENLEMKRVLLNQRKNE